MDDFINRKKLLDDIENLTFHTTVSFPLKASMIHEIESIMKKLIDSIIEIIKNSPYESGWISVEDALPEIYEKVLTADIDGYVTENYRCNIRAGLEWSKGFRITHWMPKPEPPKEESKNEND